MSVTLGELIGVLDAAYPPALAHDWDSVGLVCGDPAEPVTSVTIAVDATESVLAEVPEGGLLLAHHPLLLRGVDTVAASTAKGALIHRMIRAGQALFTAHTNADSASPGVSDALADALGLVVEDVLSRGPSGPDLDKWVVFVPVEHAGALRDSLFAAGAGQIGDYSCCSWSVTGTGQFLPDEGATPAIGQVGAVEQVAEDRVEVIAPSTLRPRVLAALRHAHPYEEPAFDVFALAPLPADVGIGRICSLPEPEPLSAFVSRVRGSLPVTTWGCARPGSPTRWCPGWPSVAARAIRCSARCGAPGCRRTSPRTCGTTPPTSTAGFPMWRWSTSRTGQVSSPGVTRRRHCCAAVSTILYRCG